MYERLLKDVKKTLHKMLGRTHLTFEQLETVTVNIEKHLNNCPLMYVESGEGEDRVLTPNTIMWGQGKAARLEMAERLVRPQLDGMSPS